MNGSILIVEISRFNIPIDESESYGLRVVMLVRTRVTCLMEHLIISMFSEGIGAALSQFVIDNLGQEGTKGMGRG